MLHEHEMVKRGLAVWYAGRLIPVMRGGDGRDEPLFPQVPQTDEALSSWDLSSLDDTELSTLAAAIRDRIQEVASGRRDPEIVGDLTQQAVKDQVQQAVLAVEKIDDELSSRADQEGEYDSDIDDLASRAGVRSETEEEGDEDEGDGEEGGEETASVAETPDSTLSNQPARRGPLPAARAHRPAASTQVVDSALRVTAHAAAIGAPYEAMHILDRRELGEFLTDVIRRSRVSPGQKTVLAHATYSYPRERRLEDGPDGHEVNSRRIREALDPKILTHQALTASGALCAPLPPIYELPGIETAARPVRDALPSFQAARGGVQVGTTPVMGTYAAATDIVLEADNALGGTHAVKNCMRIECPAFTSVTADSIYQCLEADNLAAMAYPELMSRIYDLVNAEQARLADSRLLDLIKAASKKVTYGANTASAWYYLNAAIYRTAAGIRSRNRTAVGLGMQALMPAWIVDLLALDSSRHANQDMRPQTRAAIETYLGGMGITPYFYLDGPSTGTGQIFPAEVDGTTLDGFPTHAQIGVFPAGTFLHLDAGELNLGVVRDSSLNSTNDFQTFQETWESVAKVGVESIWIDLTFFPSGQDVGLGTAETS